MRAPGKMGSSNKVSILRRTTSHLDDAALAELWTNALAEGHDAGDHPHFRACAECRLRFVSFSKWLEDIRTDAITEADQEMTADRLAAQQAQIFRRLEGAERPARVIAFPHVPDSASRPSPVRRWIAGAAVASFIVGIALGQVLNVRTWSIVPSVVQFRGPVEPAATVPAARGPAVVPAVATLNEEATLAELEEAATPRYEALRAYDTLTPRAADFVQPR